MLLQLIQILLVMAAAGAGLFAGQFSRMGNKRFDDATKLMLGISVALVLLSDLLNLTPGSAIAAITGIFFTGGTGGFFVAYLLFGLLIYTAAAYGFSYYGLTKERLAQARTRCEKMMSDWRARQSQVANQHSLADKPEAKHEPKKD